MRGSSNIRTKQKTAAIIGTQGTHGTLNERGRLGWVFRNTITPIETKTKAERVPMLTSSATVLIGVMPAIMATVIPVIQVLRKGVLYFG